MNVISGHLKSTPLELLDYTQIQTNSACNRISEILKAMDPREYDLVSVVIPLDQTAFSGVLDTLDPSDDVILPAHIGVSLEYLPALLEFVSTHELEINGATDAELHCMTVSCLPSLASTQPYRHALQLLQFVEFMDITLAVKLMFGFLFHTIQSKGTVEGVLQLLFPSGEFKTFSGEKQAEISEHLLGNLHVLF
jgi:hypothetical protein